MTITRIVLADDHPVVLRGLKAMLAEVPDFQVVGEASDGPAAVRMIEQLRPEVAVVDFMMPGLNGLEVTRQVSRRSPQTRIVILSMHASEGYVVDTLRSGATGYVLKDSSDVDLVQAVREVAAGRRYLSRPLSERALSAYLEMAASGKLERGDMLSRREREVLQLAADGRTNAEIGDQLQISPRTAETHRTRIMHKLGLKSQAELVRYVLTHGILPLDTV